MKGEAGLSNLEWLREFRPFSFSESQRFSISSKARPDETKQPRSVSHSSAVVRPADLRYMAICETGSLQSPEPELPPTAHN